MISAFRQAVEELENAYAFFDLASSHQVDLAIARLAAAEAQVNYFLQELKGEAPKRNY